MDEEKGMTDRYFELLFAGLTEADKTGPEFEYVREVLSLAFVNGIQVGKAIESTESKRLSILLAISAAVNIFLVLSR